MGGGKADFNTTVASRSPPHFLCGDTGCFVSRSKHSRWRKNILSVEERVGDRRRRKESGLEEEITLSEDGVRERWFKEGGRAEGNQHDFTTLPLSKCVALNTTE